jgi:carbonyl reductase 1
MPMNIPSKVRQIGITRVFARGATKAARQPNGAMISAAWPGLALTDATRDFMGTAFKAQDAQTPEEAARDLLWLATLPDSVRKPYGELARHRAVIAFGD